MRHSYALLLAGGGGSRFWPQSRTLEPKQFLPLYKDKVLFTETLQRLKPLIPAQNIFIATSESYRNRILEFTAKFKIPAANIIFEPEPKNTAASIALGTHLIYLRDARACVSVFPCDHLIKNRGRFLRLLRKAEAACADKLVVFGIPAYRPATGYGYIKIKNEKLKMKNLLPVDKFLEKPDLKTTRRLIKTGGYFWNSGIFVGLARVFLQEIKKNLPFLYKQVLRVKNQEDINLIWGRLKAVSFDQGVLEKSRHLGMLKAQGLGWSDLGSWQVWDEHLMKDNRGNALKADVFNLGSKNITVLGANRLIAAIGLENLIIVDTPDALLITKKERSEEVKKVVDLLKKKQRPEYYLHKTVRRQWGTYTVLEKGKGFKVKLVEVLPRRALSLQLHKKRSEHWIVVEGRARVIQNKKIYEVSPNESTFIPRCCKHRLINPANTPLKIIEVQAGDYLEEDDIVRFEGKIA